MRHFLLKIVNTLDSFNDWFGKTLALLILLMIGIVIYEVVCRYWFDNPTSWAFEAATMVFGTYVICGGAYALLKKAHVSMDLFYSHWSDRTKAIIDACTYPLAAFFFSLLFWQSLGYGIDSIKMDEHASTLWGPPLYHWKMTLPFGILLLLLQQLADFIRNVTFAITGEKL